MSAIDTITHAMIRSDGSRLRRTLLIWIGRFDLAQERRRTRRALAQMSDEQLRDIGLSRMAARQEAQRGFWD